MTRHLTNGELMAEITAKMFLGDIETDLLTEAFRAATKAGIDTNQVVRNLFAKQDRLNLPAVLAALKPAPPAGGSVPYHLPDCRCGGSGWVDTDERANPTDDAVPTGFVARCLSGAPIGEDEYHAWKAKQPPPKLHRERKGNTLAIAGAEA